jgi:hypothetical protein
LAFSSLRSLSSSGFASASLFALTSNAVNACWARTDSGSAATQMRAASRAWS